MKRTSTDMNRAATPTLEAGLANVVHRAPAETCGEAMSITELQMCSVPPLHDNPSLDYAQAGQKIRDWLYSGAKPQSEFEIKKIASFCVRQKLPNALSWLVLQCEIDNLKLPSCELGSEGMQMIAGWLEHCPRPIDLDIAHNNISEEGAFALASALKTNSTVTGLNVCGNYISARGAEALADALKTNSTLTTLEISENEIDATSIAVLADALKINSTLAHLRVHSSNNQKHLLGDADAAKFADALKTNSTLTSLEISSHEIDVAGAAALADALRTNSKLINLNLANNTFGDAGAAVLADALKNNSTLTNLDVSNNGIGDTGAAAFAAALERNSTLTVLDVCHQFIGNAGIAALANALKTNSTLTDLIYGEENDCDEKYAEAVVFDALQDNVTLTGLDGEGGPFSTEPVRRRLQVNRNAKPFALAAADAFMTLPTSWESKLSLEVGALIVKEMIVRAPVEGDGVEGLKSLIIASDIVKQRHCDETS